MKKLAFPQYCSCDNLILLFNGLINNLMCYEK